MDVPGRVDSRGEPGRGEHRGAVDKVRGEVGADDEGAVGDAVESEEDRAGGGVAAAGERDPLSIIHEELLEPLNRILIAAAGGGWLFRNVGIAGGVRLGPPEHGDLVMYSLGRLTESVGTPGYSWMPSRVAADGDGP
jgi:hypothetical protein